MGKKQKAKTENSGSSSPVKKIAIVGLPNTGKSQVFNSLTGEYALVANYPLTTVEMKRTRCEIDGEPYEVIDTPGLHCLYIHSEEELIVRDMIFTDVPDIIIQCIDANQLKQSLTLTADLLELGIPMIISLNAIDETARRGVLIDSGRLSGLLGVPVVESRTVDSVDTRELKESLRSARRGKWNLHYGQVIDKGISDIESELPEQMSFKRKVAVLLLLADPFLVDYLREKYGREKVGQLQKKVNKIRRGFRGNFGRAINKKRGQWVTETAENSTKKQKLAPGEFSRAFGRLSRHPIFGLPILAIFLVTTFLLVTYVAAFLEAQLSALLLDPTVDFVERLFTAEDESIRSQFWHDFLIGHYGILTLGLFNAIGTILPILSVFFLMFGFLEDIGYIPNLCVLTKRIFARIGLTGKSIMPLVLGFGCKTMATLTTRGLQSRKEKFIAVYLIAFAIPCSAQMGIDMAIFGRIGIKAFMIGYGALVLIELCAGFALNKIIKEEEKSDFIQELPAIRIPSPKAIATKTYYRLYWFLKEAIPIFIIAVAALFLLDKTGVLDLTKTLMSPIVEGWLRLPRDIVDVLILAVARHEVAAGRTLEMVDAGELNYVQCIVTVVITTMFVPCFANVVAMCKQMGVKTGLAMAFAINISAFILAGILNWILIFTIGRWVL
ncbi:MAG: ferrous iron transport protein B [Phycisphaerae bacterium]|nr:ferrous iron transport protein B [Phycisphaerae bacterium]NIP54386.1 ferrous iron transport protein B [Phycisphaerae bacterium]NIS53245.1 ferrous iron transport protein B [Phycisphaerae bacterium]NIU10771.1 ferrous iron transport protein B [Phycisphaerae bacterium]NIU58566.1 ferrous iron transport protein B [Phycisphaerae bacterium]